MRHLSFSGLAKDESTLKDLKVTKGAKIMVVGSTLNDVLSVSKPSPQELQEAAKASAATKEPLSQQKVLDVSSYCSNGKLKKVHQSILLFIQVKAYTSAK